jgi:hypothetical protein
MSIYCVTKDNMTIASFVNKEQTAIFLHRKRGLCEADDDATFDYRVVEFQGPHMLSDVSGDKFLEQYHEVFNAA